MLHGHCRPTSRLVLTGCTCDASQKLPSRASKETWPAVIPSRKTRMTMPAMPARQATAWTRAGASLRAPCASAWRCTCRCWRPTATSRRSPALLCTCAPAAIGRTTSCRTWPGAALPRLRCQAQEIKCKCCNELETHWGFSCSLAPTTSSLHVGCKHSSEASRRHVERYHASGGCGGRNRHSLCLLCVAAVDVLNANPLSTMT